MENKPNSIEEEVTNYNVCEWIGNFGKYFVKGEYGMIASMFRFPTTARRWYYDQFFIQREDLDVLGSCSDPKGFGVSLGGLVGAIFDTSFVAYSLQSAINDNYIPLTILGATNLASGIYELRRYNKRRGRKKKASNFHVWGS